MVVGVDPPASAHGDSCGIVVAGRLGRAGLRPGRPDPGAAPRRWPGPRRAARAAADFGAQAVVAEANQGGEMVRSTLAAADCPCPVRLVHARQGKRARAEPGGRALRAGGAGWSIAPPSRRWRSS
ncbi:MAG: hypothetical protein WDM92_07465 [Caulobacteraceae bacterium]